MNFREFRNKSKRQFEENAIEVRDVDIILSEYFKLSVPELSFKKEILDNDKLKLDKIFKKRLSGMPISKIFKTVNFYGLDLYINNNVLSPRPETELLVEKALETIWNKSYKVLDLCTGSGAVACAITKNSNAEVTATDISTKALYVARKNANAHNLDIKFVKSDMFANIKGEFDVIISNPPYIETEVCSTLDKEVKEFDPMLALDGGVDGLDFYRTIAHNMNYLKSGGTLLLEIGYNQGEKIKEIFKDYKVEIIKDYNNLDRIAIIKRNNI